MGYGGTGYATVSVSIAQADVQAIVDGLTGSYGRTLTDIDNDLNGLLYYNGNSAAALLQSLLDQMGSTTNALYDIENYLSGSWYGNLYNGNRAVDYLDWINSNIGSLQSYLSGSWGGPLTDASNNLYGINNNTGGMQNYLAGWSGGPLTNIDGNTSNTAYYLYDGNRAVDYLNWISSNIGSVSSYLSGYTYGALYDGTSAVSYLNWINSNTGNTSNYLWSGYSGQSAADLLYDIRNLLQQFTFDAYGRLQVTTA